MVTTMMRRRKKKNRDKGIMWTESSIFAIDLDILGKIRIEVWTTLLDTPIR